MDAAQQKRELREAIRKRLAEFSAKERAAEGRTFCRTLWKILPDYLQVIAAFVPLPDEVDISSFLLECLTKGIKVFLPRFEGGEMVFREVKKLTNLPLGPLNVPEPQVTAPLLDSQVLSHVLVPGRAFDRKGNRLGRGNGGYDHWIALQRNANPQTKFFGVCFECQLVQSVPVEAHDAKVDAVITARGLLH